MELSLHIVTMIERTVVIYNGTFGLVAYCHGDKSNNGDLSLSFLIGFKLPW